MLELIILAALAIVVLYQLYAVLGRRVGRGPEELPQPAPSAEQAVRPQIAPPQDGAPLTGLAAVRAFATGDRATLKPLVAPDVMAGFESEMAKRETEGRTEQVEFLQTPRADFENVTVIGDLAKAAVRFLAEYRSRTKGPEGEGVEDHRTAEIWTFERNLKSRDPNWTLIHVDAAEA